MMRAWWWKDKSRQNRIGPEHTRDTCTFHFGFRTHHRFLPSRLDATPFLELYMYILENIQESS